MSRICWTSRHCIQHNENSIYAGPAKAYPDRVGQVSQPVAEVLAYLHVQMSAISCNVVGSILHVLGKDTDTAIVGCRWTGGGRDTAPCTVNWCKKVRISFELLYGLSEFRCQ